MRITFSVRMWIRRGSVGSASQRRILGCEKHSQGVCKSRERKLMCKGGNRDKGEGSRSC